MIGLIQRYWLMLTLVMLVLVTSLSLWPVKHVPQVPGGDKLHHFVAYAGLIFPLALSRPRHWLLPALGFLLWSAVIELLQPSVNRYAEWHDLFANLGGIASGIAAAVILRPRNKKSAETQKS